jgi:adenine-specific DNA-methyltransferase
LVKLSDAKRGATPDVNFMVNESEQKLRGGYYTPLDLATFLCRWVGEIHPTRILEPSCGDGVFFQSMATVDGLRASDVLGFELDAMEAAKSALRAATLGLHSTTIHAEDFLGYALDQMASGNNQVDAVVGNPPFVRYQYLPPQFQARAELIFDELGLRFTKHTNAWVPFILASMAMLRPGGRLAMIVPAEIMHVTHAQTLRTYLGEQCRRLVIVDPEELWFDGTLQGAVILMAEKRKNQSDVAEGLGMYPVKGREFLRLDPSAVFNAPQPINGKTVEGKWTRALLDLETRNLFDELAAHDDVHKFDDIAQVDVGIVTGANKFFLVPDDVVADYGLAKWAHPMFGRSGHCPGVIYDDRQHAENATKGNPTNFLWFNEKFGKVDAAAQAYISTGEFEKLHTRYKCRVRSPWYTVPSVYATEIGMLKRAHDTPRLILNKIGAYTTDTAYRIRTQRVVAEKLVGCFINPLTALSAEVEGRHYGGGVLELIPSEIERLIIPLPAKANVDLVDLDRSIRSLPTRMMLASQGRNVLGRLGLSAAKQECLLNGWEKLKDRRQRTSNDVADVSN